MITGIPDCMWFVCLLNVGGRIARVKYAAKTCCVSYSLHSLIRSGSSATRHPKDGWLKQAPAFAASVQLPTEASQLFFRHILHVQCCAPMH